jgi:predicted transcriptional regulator
MIQDVLTYLISHDGAPVTEIQRVFKLSADMAANLMIQLEDAGLLYEQKLEACHHMDTDGNMLTQTHTGGCGSGNCASSDGACGITESFERGCCGMNAPYRITPSGRTFLERFAAS